MLRSDYFAAFDDLPCRMRTENGVLVIIRAKNQPPDKHYRSGLWARRVDGAGWVCEFSMIDDYNHRQS